MNTLRLAQILNNKQTMEININGKSYSSMQEWADEEKYNPDSTSIIWEYQEATTIINGRPQMADGSYGRGKCWYKGKCYEGEIDYRDDGIYVGGELVKPNENYNPTETMETTEAKNYETLTLKGQGHSINANVINNLVIHGQGNSIRTGKCGDVKVYGMGNNVHKGEPMSFADYLKNPDWEEIVNELSEKCSVYILDGEGSLECNIPDDFLKKEYATRFARIECVTDADLKTELERRGWSVKCTRTTTEEL